MQCEIRSMEEKSSTKTDTLPPRGRVHEVRKEWLVHSDGALAHRLQDEEIKQHLLGNRSRNHQIREDFPRAKHEQDREAKEATKLYQRMVLQQEEEDAQVAAEIAHMIEVEEDQRRKALENDDEELARVLQEKEQHKIERRERDRRELESHTPRKEKHPERHLPPRKVHQSLVGNDLNLIRPYNTQNGRQITDNSHQLTPNNNVNLGIDDFNNVGLPLQEDIIHPMRLCNLTETVHAVPMRHSPSPPPMSEEDARKIQEEQDAELARRLQEEESHGSMSKMNRDRLLAIETQDKELARLLQEKERNKARRAREKAKQKAAMKKLQEENNADVIRTADVVSVSSLNSQPARPTELNLKNKHKPRFPDPEEIVELPDQRMSNIAMAIDPTYSKQSQRTHSQKMESKPSAKISYQEPDDISPNIPLPDPDLVEELNAPPYMPIQGQRRLPEKKTKSKESCRQQ